jgi:hypothetical protein
MPSHVKESFTAATVVLSPLAAERSCCVTGCWVSRSRPQVDVCWPVSVDVVVAADVGVSSSVKEVKSQCSEGVPSGRRSLARGATIERLLADFRRSHPMRMRSLAFSFALLLSGFVPSAALAQRPAAVDASEPTAPVAPPAGRVQGAVARPKDGVQHQDLDAAWAEYDKEIDAVTKDVETAIEQKLNAAAAAGDLDAAMKWRTADEQFQKDGRIPEELDDRKSEGKAKKPSRAPATSPRLLISKATERLAKAYELAEQDLTKQHDFDKATQVRAERTLLRTPAKPVPPRPISQRDQVLAIAVGAWRHPNGGLEEVRKDGSWVVNGDPLHPWSGTWLLDLGDPNKPCVVRRANRGVTTRWYVDFSVPDQLASGDGGPPMRKKVVDSSETASRQLPEIACPNLGGRLKLNDGDWSGEWVRQGQTNVFDCQMFHQRARETVRYVATIERRGDRVVVRRTEYTSTLYGQRPPDEFIWDLSKDGKALTWGTASSVARDD